MALGANDIRKACGAVSAPMFATGVGCAVSHTVDAAAGRFVPNFKIDPRITAWMFLGAIPLFNHFIYGRREASRAVADPSQVQEEREAASGFSWNACAKRVAQVCGGVLAVAAVALTNESPTQRIS